MNLFNGWRSRIDWREPSFWGMKKYREYTPYAALVRRYWFFYTFLEKHLNLFLQKVKVV